MDINKKKSYNKYVNLHTYFLRNDMKDNEFGEYLKKLRKSQIPKMSQEDLAKKIGRGKMTISQFEGGKNTPPQGSLLTKIANAMSLSDTERKRLFFLAAQSRGCVPSDIETYFFENPEICDAIRAAMNSKQEIDWSNIALNIGCRDEKDKRTN